MVSRYEYVDEVPQQIHKNDEDRKLALSCFSSFMEDVFGLSDHLTLTSEESCKFHRDDMRRAYINGWYSALYHLRGEPNGTRKD